MSNIFAHSLTTPGDWEPLDVHLAAVARTAAALAAPFGAQALAQAAGALHDIGKASAGFQTYIRAAGPSVDHSTAGALAAIQAYPGAAGRALAFVIAGHHAGLADGDRLGERLAAYASPADLDWRDHARPPDAAAVDACAQPQPNASCPGFAEAFAIRMLFSCLVDADFLETERFYAANETPPRAPDRDRFADIDTLAQRLSARLGAMAIEDTPVNALRAQVLEHARAKAALPPGLFTLTVPTGGGKTLTSLAFALEHARRHGLRRVVYVIPFTSIIEQTAQVFREALGDADVLEHHASFDWESELPRNARPRETDAGAGDHGLAALRRAAENWAAPVVVTTAVQAFESLFANRTSRCRKLHNLSRAVLVLDEAQTLPLPLLRPCLAALDELARNYGSSVVLCTATQPAVRVQDGFKGGLDIPVERELAPDPPALYARLKRVRIERRAGVTPDGEIAARFAETEQMMAIVNSRAHACDLFDQIRDRPGAAHLSTLMCPRHRREVLARTHARLAAGEPVRLVATSLIEAGVDISFPEVWRATAGLEAILQAAGRCNRNDELAREGRLGRVVVFDPGDDHLPPHALRAFQQAAQSVLSSDLDPLKLEAVQAYFRQLYWVKGDDAFDAARLDKARFPILRAIADAKARRLFPFKSIAEAFRMIEQAMEPVIAPWDALARDTLARIAKTDRPLAADIRRLQSYVVPLPRQVRADWLAQGVLTSVHPRLGDAMLTLVNLDAYDPSTGVRLDLAIYRNAESNIW